MLFKIVQRVTNLLTIADHQFADNISQFFSYHNKEGNGKISCYLHTGGLFRRKLSLKLSALPGFIACTFSLNPELQNMLILSQESTPATKQQIIRHGSFLKSKTGAQEILSFWNFFSTCVSFFQPSPGNCLRRLCLGEPYQVINMGNTPQLFI